jgi:DNA-binding transcriptional MerR regulator
LVVMTAELAEMAGTAETAELVTIGELADRTGVAPSALRYYEELGLVSSVARLAGRRCYHPSAVETVGLIRLFQEVGFSLAEVGSFMASRAGSASGSGRGMIAAKLAELDARIAKAEVARVALDHAVHCPKEDLLDCPNFWGVVSARLDGTPLREIESLGS